MYIFPTIDWTNEANAADTAEKLLKKIAEDKELLTELLLQARKDPSLFRMCECHTYDDKIVLFSGLESHGYRIRFRLAKQVETERIHNHRFTAIHHIIRGGFSQNYYVANKPVSECSKTEDFDFKYSTSHSGGESFEVNYRDFHTSRTSENTISLLLRGPVMNKQAIGINCDDNSIRIRKGFADSSAEENQSHLMSFTVFDNWTNILRSQNIVN